jgi:hypothetical protein
MPERRSTDRQTQLYSGGRREEEKQDQKAATQWNVTAWLRNLPNA